MKKSISLALVFSLAICLAKAQKCSIMGTWIYDPAKIEILKPNIGKTEIGKNPLTMAELDMLKADFNLPDSVVFYENKVFKIFTSADDVLEVEEGTYSLKKKGYKWKRKTPGGKTISKMVKKEVSSMPCYLNENGINFFNNISEIKKEQGQSSARGALAIHYVVYPKIN